MDFSRNGEQKMMIAAMRRFVAEALKPLETGIDEHAFLDAARSCRSSATAATLASIESSTVPAKSIVR